MTFTWEHVVAAWLPEVTAAIDALDEPDEWKAARHGALTQVVRRLGSEFKSRVLLMTLHEGVQMLRDGKREAERLTDPRWLPKRPGRRMPSVAAIAKHWAGRHPFEDISLDDPRCFGCRCSAAAWSSSSFERAHLVDRFLGGLDHAGNLVPLCSACHRVMPMFEIDQGQDALGWVIAGGWTGLVVGLARPATCLWKGYGLRSIWV